MLIWEKSVGFVVSVVFPEDVTKRFINPNYITELILLNLAVIKINTYTFKRHHARFLMIF